MAIKDLGMTKDSSALPRVPNDGKKKSHDELSNYFPDIG